MALPALMVGVPVLFGIAREKEKGPLPWQNPGFVALVLSMIVFGVGGLMGNLISGSDTRTPAHYHGVITGVSLAAVGLLLSYACQHLTAHRETAGCCGCKSGSTAAANSRPASACSWRARMALRARRPRALPR